MPHAQRSMDMRKSKSIVNDGRKEGLIIQRMMEGLMTSARGGNNLFGFIKGGLMVNGKAINII